MASRPAARYLRGSVIAPSAARQPRTAAVNTLFSWVAMLILVSPAATAARQRHHRARRTSRAAPAAPAPPARMRLTRSRSSTASLVSIACELPTATASASTPVVRRKRAASRRLGPGTWRVHAVFAADLAELGLEPDPAVMTPSGDLGRCRHVLLRSCSPDASNITEPKPRPARVPDQLRARRMIQVHGDRHGDAALRPRAPPGRSARARRDRRTQFSLICSTITGAPAASAPGHDRLGMLDPDHVERARRRAGRPSRADDLGDRHHGMSSAPRRSTCRLARAWS